MKYKIDKENYNWGTLRKIEVERGFSIIIHPEHFEKIEELFNNEIERDVISFTDEQSNYWFVKTFEEYVIFFYNSKQVTVKFEELI